MTQSNLPATPSVPAQQTAGGGKLYLAFVLSGESFAIEIERIREIIEYHSPTPVPMMPTSVCGVINLRGVVVPVLDLAVRFGRSPVVVGRRSCYVIVEAAYGGATHIIGLLVDRVTAVIEIADSDIEPPPSFGARVNVDFITGMARHDNRFLIILNVVRALSIEEISAIVQVNEENNPHKAAA